MAIKVGKVQSIENGKFFVKDLKGNIKELKLEDTIFEDDIIYGKASNSSSARLEIVLNNNDLIVLLKNQKQLIDSSLIDEEFGKEEIFFKIEDIRQIIKVHKNIKV